MENMDPEEEYDPIESLEKLDRFLDGEEQTTLYFELEKLGEAPPMAEGLMNEEVTRALTDLIWGIFDLGVMVDDADHLTDRELYVELLDYCDRPTVVFPEDPDMWCHWSPVDGCAEDDMQIILRYYMDEEDRQRWAEDCPDLQIPPSELPPYYRSWLPQRGGLRD